MTRPRYLNSLLLILSTTERWSLSSIVSNAIEDRSDVKWSIIATEHIRLRYQVLKSTDHMLRESTYP
jgi:hypothetical protein